MIGPRYPHVIALNEEDEKKAQAVRKKNPKISWTVIFMKGVELFEKEPK